MHVGSNISVKILPAKDGSPLGVLKAVTFADGHVIEPADLWTKWLPGKYRQEGPRVENRPYEMVDPNDPSRTFGHYEASNY